MKTSILWVFLFLLAFGARAQQLNVTLGQENFEGSATGYTANTITGTSSYFQKATTATPTSQYANFPLALGNQQGTNFWAAEAVRGTSDGAAVGPAGVLTLNGINTTGYKNLEITIALAAPKSGPGAVAPGNRPFEADDQLLVQYSFDNTNFTTLATFRGNTAFNGTRGDLSLNGTTATADVVDSNFKEFTFGVPATGSSLYVRVVVDEHGASEEIAFDNIRVIGDEDNVAKPVLALSTTETNTPLSYTEGDPDTQITSSIAVSHSGTNTTLSSATVAIQSGGYVAGQDLLAFSPQNGISIQSNANGTLVLTGTAALGAYQAALRSVTYRNSNNSTATGGARIVAFTVNDGTSNSNTVTRTINVTTTLNAAAGLPYTEDFELDGEGTRYTANTFAVAASSTGFFRATASPPVGPGNVTPTNSTFANYNGTGYWFGEGTNGPGSPASPVAAVQLAPVNAAGYVNLRFTLRMGQGQGSLSSPWANTDFVKLYYRVNGGTWVLFGAFYGNNATNELRQDTNLDGVAETTSPRLTSTLQDILFTNIPNSAAVANLDFKVEQSSIGTKELAFDYIRITGTQQTTVNSIVRANANPTNAATVNYTVTFGAPVTGLTAANFSLTTTGTVSTASVGTPVAGAGNTWTVPVNTGTGSGSLTLNLANDTNLSADITTTLPFAGETYTIDKTGPVVTSVAVPANGSYRATQVLSFTVNFSEAVTVTGTPQLALTIGSTARQAVYASGSGSTALVFSYTVQNGEVDTDGIALGALTLNGGTLRDAIGNDATLTLNNVPSTAGILVDAVAPTVVSSVRQNPVTATTGATSLTFRVTFSEAVTGVTTGSFTFVTTTGSTTGSVASVAAVSGSNGTQYDVTVNGVNGNGTVRLDVKSSGSGIGDAAGNGLSGGFTGGQTYTVSQSVTVASVTRLTPSPTATTQVSYQVVFSGSVSGVTVNNFSVTSNTGASISSVSGSGTTYTAVVNTGTGDGTLTLNVANSTGITPTVSNVPYTAGETYTITKSFAAAPTLRIQAAGSASGNGDVTAFVDVVQVLQSGTSTVVANGLQNGSFETNNVPANGFRKATDATPVVAAPWAFTGTAGVARYGSAFDSQVPGRPQPLPPNGDAVALIQSAGDNNASLSQNLAVPTGSYQVNFQTAQRYYTAVDQRLNVFVNDVFVGSIQPNQTPTYEPFTSASFNVFAPTLTATVSTTSASPTSTAPIPFAVSFTAGGNPQSVGTTFTAADVTVSGGTLNAASFSGSGAGPYTFTVTPSGFGLVSVSLAANVAQDANNTGNSLSNIVSVQFQAATITVSPATLTNGTRGTAYNQAITALGGTAPYTYAITGGALPAGLILTNGTIAGTPAASGSFTFTVTATDNSAAPGPYSGSRTYTLSIAAPAITLTPATLPAGTVAATYNQTITASGGTAPYTYAITAGALPAGLTLTSAGVLSGTPTAGGSFTFTLTATDASPGFSGGPYSGSQTYTLTIVAPTIAVSPATLPSGTRGATYNQTITALGGTAPYTYAITGGALPAGLTLSAAGVLSGTPAASGSFTFMVTATDASTGAGPYTGSRSYTLTIAAPAIALSPTTLPAGTVAVVYNQALTASGGTAPYTYAVTAGALPAGLTLSSAGVLSGTPTAGGSFVFTVTATDASTSASGGPYNGSLSYTLTIAAPTIAVSPPTLPNGTQGTVYNQVLTASGGTAPYTFAIMGGALPAGLTLSAAGVLSGTPTVNGPYTFTVTATDASTGAGPYTGSRSYTLSIAAPVVTVVTWTGNTNTSWFDASNWTPNQVPNATIDAVIPTSPTGNRFPTIAVNTSQANARNVSIAAGASLTMSGNTLTLAANLTNNGSFSGFAGPNGGTLALGGSAPALLNGGGVNRFWNLTVGANGAQLNNPNVTSVRRVLTLNGNFATTGNPFTLISDAAGTALVVNNGGAVVTGNATVQRYIDPSQNPNAGYRHVSAPIANATVASLTTSGFTPVVNPDYNTVGNTVTPFPTVFGYDQARLATAPTPLSTFDKGWYSPAALGAPLAVGQGYTVNLAANQTWNFVGALNNGPVTQTLARNAGATAADAGLHLVGNPYPAPLDWSQVGATDRPNVDGVMYVFTSDDPTNPYAGTYRFYQVNPSGDFGNVSPVLPLGKAFFVRVTPGQTSGTLTFKNSHRVTDYANPIPVFQRTADARPAAHLTLRAAAGSAPADDAFVYFDGGATDGFDAAYDAEKLANPSGLNLSSSLSAAQRLCVNGLAPLTAAQRVVPLAVGVPVAGTYTLAAAELRNLGSTPTYLRDLQTGAVIDLAQQPSYSFTVSNASALLTTRFELVFSPQAVLATAPAALAAQVGLYPNPASTAVFVELPAVLGRKAVTAGLVDALGRVVLTQVLPAGLATHTLPLTNLATGVYSLRLQTDAGVIVKKLVVE
ncbi:putative Ig domain-containing protein [Hymenobacter ruricola]|uniref:Ig domain-containing protein n=1 Tax=Hymenobacter ruricola TaxID=2791023 RepID=A0ABS0I3N7_9BACT|nr:putative Ig domain-containing protein [Hymenobacter ruricola]MBF9221174.1 putative Ig domain-containing protein [Hymenobacter ruricola]